jgi:hypothetical protein
MKTTWDRRLPLTHLSEPLDGSNGLTSTDRAMREEILHRARTIWEQRGRPTGVDLSIWLEAENKVHSGSKHCMTDMRPVIET